MIRNTIIISATLFALSAPAAALASPGSSGLASSGGGSIGEGDGPSQGDYDNGFGGGRPTQVPEPASMAMVGAGLAGLLIARRRFKLKGR